MDTNVKIDVDVRKLASHVLDLGEEVTQLREENAILRQTVANLERQLECQQEHGVTVLERMTLIGKEVA